MAIVRSSPLPGVAASPPFPLGVRATAEERSVPLWLWWNLLSLDAPSVAVLWAILFARVSGTRWNPWEALALALVVWLVYVADRLLDARWPGREALRARHLFCKKHAAVFLSAMAGAAALLALVVFFRLSHGVVWNGTRMGLLVGAYMIGIHIRPLRLVRSVPKELFVGVLFAAGTTLPQWTSAQGVSGFDVFSWILFALVCALNCAAIEYWEGHPGAAASGPATHGLALRSAAGVARPALFLASLCFACALLPQAAHVVPAFLAAGMAALCLLLIDGYKAQLSLPALRVLADAALVFPALLILGLQR